jgi:hypothetical protein
MERKYFSYAEALKFAIITFIDNFFLFLKVALAGIVLFLLPILLALVINGGLQLAAKSFLQHTTLAKYVAVHIASELRILVLRNIVILTEIFLFLWYGAGFKALCLKLYNKQPAHAGDVFIPVTLAFRYIIANFLYYIAVMIGLVFFIIPGIIIALRYCFVGYSILDKKIGIIESFTDSARITHGARWRLFGFQLFLAILVILLGLGVTLIYTPNFTDISSNGISFSTNILTLITIPLTILAHTYIYYHLLDQTTQQEAARSMTKFSSAQ